MENRNNLTINTGTELSVDFVPPFSVAPGSLEDFGDEEKKLYLESRKESLKNRQVVQNQCLKFSAENFMKNLASQLEHYERMRDLEYDKAKDILEKAKTHNQKMLDRNIAILETDEYKDHFLNQSTRSFNSNLPETSLPNTSAHFDCDKRNEDSKRESNKTKNNITHQENDQHNKAHLLMSTNLPKDLKEKLMRVSEISKKRCRRKECLQRVKVDHKHYIVDLNKCDASLKRFVEGDHQGLSGILRYTKINSNKDYSNVKKNYY